MKKSLPKLKKTVKSFLAEEDAKLINKTASKIALTTAFTSTIALINIESGNAFSLGGHSNHSHTNHLELPTNSMIAPADVPKYGGSWRAGVGNFDDTYNPHFLNLGEHDDVLSKESFEIYYDYESETTTDPKVGTSTTYTYEISYLDLSAANGEVVEKISISGSSSNYISTVDTTDGNMSLEINIENSDYSVSGYSWGGSSPSYDRLENIEITLDSNTQTLTNVDLGDSGSIKFDNIDTIEVPADTNSKTIKAEHANHFNHSNDGGLFGTTSNPFD